MACALHYRIPHFWPLFWPLFLPFFFFILETVISSTTAHNKYNGAGPTAKIKNQKPTEYEHLRETSRCNLNESLGACKEVGWESGTCEQAVRGWWAARLTTVESTWVKSQSGAGPSFRDLGNSVSVTACAHCWCVVTERACAKKPLPWRRGPLVTRCASPSSSKGGLWVTVG